AEWPARRRLRPRCPRRGLVLACVMMAPMFGATWMQREPTAISLVDIAIPSMPVRSQRPISEKVIGSSQAPAQVVRDLERAGHALWDRLGQRHERVDLAGILAVDDVHAGLAQPVAVGAALVAKRVEARGDDHGGRLALEARRAERRASHVAPVRTASQVLLHVP